MGKGASGSVFSLSHHGDVVSSDTGSRAAAALPPDPGFPSSFAFKKPLSQAYDHSLVKECRWVRRLPFYQEKYHLGWGRNGVWGLIMPLGYTWGTVEFQSVTFGSLWVWRMLFAKMRFLHSLPLDDPLPGPPSDSQQQKKKFLVHRDVRRHNVIFRTSGPILDLRSAQTYLPSYWKGGDADNDFATFFASIQRPSRADCRIQTVQRTDQGSSVQPSSLELIDFSSSEVEGERCVYGGSPVVRPDRIPKHRDETYQVRRLDDVEVFAKALLAFMKEESDTPTQGSGGRRKEQIASLSDLVNSVSVLNASTKDDVYLETNEDLLKTCDTQIVSWFMKERKTSWWRNLFRTAERTEP
mmetsp:Transcript_39719/g.102256  ORF Transcript_39719/g.102256 Transcript_39719/m.102256 type:complete len:354 (-) Transcript_39719:3493-4554(-)